LLPLEDPVATGEAEFAVLLSVALVVAVGVVLGAAAVFVGLQPAHSAAAAVATVGAVAPSTFLSTTELLLLLTLFLLTQQLLLPSTILSTELLTQQV